MALTPTNNCVLVLLSCTWVVLNGVSLRNSVLTRLIVGKNKASVTKNQEHEIKFKCTLYISPYNDSSQNTSPSPNAVC